MRDTHSYTYYGDPLGEPIRHDIAPDDSRHQLAWKGLDGRTDVIEVDRGREPGHIRLAIEIYGSNATAVELTVAQARALARVLQRTVKFIETRQPEEVWQVREAEEER
jgi:hypothetical protein